MKYCRIHLSSTETLKQVCKHKFRGSLTDICIYYAGKEQNEDTILKTKQSCKYATIIVNAFYFMQAYYYIIILLCENQENTCS